MELPLLLLTLAALCVASVPSHAADSHAEAYWKAKLGNTPMPKFMITSLKGLKEDTLEANPATISQLLSASEDDIDAQVADIDIKGQKQYNKAYEEAIIKGQRQYGKAYEEAIIKGQKQYGKAYEEAIIKGQRQYGKAYEEAIIKGQRQYGKAYEEAIIKGQKQYGKAYEEAIIKGQRQYGKAYEEAIIKGQRQYNKAYEEAIIKGQKQYGKTYEEAIIKGQRQYNKDYEEAIIKGQKQYSKGAPTPTPTVVDLLKSGLDIFFLEKNLTHPTEKLNLHFINVHKSIFLPSKLSNSIPFSKTKLPEILNLLSINPNTPQAETVEDTITSCEEAPIKGEENKHCTTSLEDLVDYVVSSIGNKVTVLSTTIDKETTMEYSIEKVKKVSNEGNLVCHKSRYPYAVFYCHSIKNTDAYVVSLVDENGKKSKGVAVCHKDTSAWNPRHLAFQLLRVKPGSVGICHFLYGNDMIWTPN